MTMKKKKQLLCEDNLRHNEYYGMQNTIDNLYQASLNGEVFTDLMSVILQRENILLAYRNIKKNCLQNLKWKNYTGFSEKLNYL